MLCINRRKFLQASSTLFMSAIISPSFTVAGRRPLLSFSTLGCPDWPFRQIVDFAVQHGYNGIELRGILRQLDLTQCDEFTTPQNRKNTLALMKDNGLRFVDLGSSCTLHFAEGQERRKNIDEGKKFIDLASDIDCKYVRVFPNLFPKEQTKAATLDLITKGLLELGEYANGSSVTVLLETHGDLVRIDDIETVVKAAQHRHTGLVWDITNMWSMTKEDPYQAYQRLKEYIRHTHIKDGKVADGKIQYTLLGQGDVPIKEAIRTLAENGYKEYYSFEWEKLWHPEIAAPEIAIADYVKVMNEVLK